MSHYASSEVGGALASKPPHIQSSMGYSNVAKAAVVPESWAVGSFHQNNPIYNKRTVVMMEGPGHHRGTSSRQVVSQLF